MSETATAASAAQESAGRTRRWARPMEEDEVREVLERNFWGTLATAADEQPYAVPLIYGYDGSSLFMVVGAGRKTRNVEANPRVSFTVTEVKDLGKRWRCVVACGEASWVSDEDRMINALEVIRRQYPGLPVRSGGGAAALAAGGYRVLRIAPETITGRIQEG